MAASCFLHILPHLMPTAIVWGTLGIATTVLLEATLSFLGIGVQPPQPSWGNIIFESQSYFQAAPWLVFFPGVVILLTALVLQPGRRRAARHPRPDPAREGLMASSCSGALAQAALILLGVAAITFVLLYALPADPAGMLAGRSATPQTVANIRHELGLDQPLLVQFWHYLSASAAGRSRPLLCAEDRGLRR